MTDLQKLIDDCLRSMLYIEASLETDALAIRQSFYEARIALQADAQAGLEEEALRQNKRVRRIYCGLHLSVRIHSGTLQVFWHEINIHSVTKCKMYKYIAMNKNGAYDLRTLKSRAHDFEWDLVKETEEKAAVIRAKWKKLILSRTTLIRLREME